MLRLAPLTRPARIILISLATPAATLWGFAIAGLWVWRGPTRLSNLMNSGAATLTILAGMFWLAMALRDRDKDMMLRSMADHLSQHDARTKPPTGPLRLVEDHRSASA